MSVSRLLLVFFCVRCLQTLRCHSECERTYNFHCVNKLETWTRKRNNNIKNIIHTYIIFATLFFFLTTPTKHFYFYQSSWSCRHEQKKLRLDVMTNAMKKKQKKNIVAVHKASHFVHALQRFNKMLLMMAKKM